MKKYLYTLFFCVWALLAYAQDPGYPPAPPLPTNVTAAEYFIDLDPGVGQGTPIALTPGVNLSNVNVAVNVNGLDNGVHRLFIRARNADGSWSIVQVREFLYNHPFPYSPSPPAPREVVAAEYYIDTDPGPGLGTAIPLTPGLDLTNVPVAVNVNSLSNGTHWLYIRTKNAEGAWSLSQTKEFVIDFNPSYPTAPVAAQNIVAAEYFFDTDPGAGNGTSIAVVPGTNLEDFAVNANTTGLALGTHRLYLRTRNQEGAWSLTHFKEFVVTADVEYPTAPAAPQNVVAAEYFIDTDPGTGKGISLPVAPGVDLNNVTAAINTAGLPLGVHRVYLRIKSQEGHWSLTQVKEFVVVADPEYSPAPAAPQHIVAAEYYVDTDPGKGQGIAIPVTPGVDVSNIAVTVNTAGLNDGFHRLGVRTKSEEGHWSLTYDSAFYVGNLAPSWTLEPATGHDFGNVEVNKTANFSLTIRNTGDVAITLSEVISSNPVFTASYTAGRVIAARGTLALPITFKPTVAGPVTAELKIKTSTAGVDSVTTLLVGNGFVPDVPPVLNLVNTAPYAGTTGVDPKIGQPGLYTYKVVYKSALNKAPQAGYPSVGIDLNGDQDYNDAGEGIFGMATEAGSGTDYVAGVTFTYTTFLDNISTTMGYRFIAKDINGNEVSSAYMSGPQVVNSVADLRIFANDISFSKDNPSPGEGFTVTARVTNSNAIAVDNVPIRFYQDDIFLGEGTIAHIDGNSSATINYNLSYPADGFFPIKVWIDENNTKGDVNVLNNYAIRPVTVGAPALPGGINLTTDVTIQYCPSLKVLIKGVAGYYGTTIPQSVAGAEVTIDLGPTQVTTTTDAHGNYSYLLPVGACGGDFTYTVKVTDFTFTSPTLTKTKSIPCSSNICGGIPPRYMSMSKDPNPCASVEGKNTSVQFKMKLQSSNPANMWRGNDYIKMGWLRIYKNDELVEEYTTGTYAPGHELAYNVSIPLASTAPVTIRGELVYTYYEFTSIPSPHYQGSPNTYHEQATMTITPAPKEPDLTVRNFSQRNFTNFSFEDANIKCNDAGTHTVRVYDSIPGGTYVLIHSQVVNSVAGGAAVRISFSNPAMAAGIHHFRMVTDVNGEVTESNENNNVMEVRVEVPKPDLSVTSLTPTATAPQVGSEVKFKAVIKNTGSKTGSFKVRFLVDGAQLGGIWEVNGMPEASEMQVTSEAYTVGAAPEICGAEIRVVVDANDEVDESKENNNTRSIVLGSDLSGDQHPGWSGSASNPVQVRAIQETRFNVPIRNIGRRDAEDVTVRFTLDGVVIGRGELALVRAGDAFANQLSFTHTFTTPGDYVVQVEVDTLNHICELSETNNLGDFHIRVIDSKQDLEVLSQYISPSLLNPSPGETVIMVGTVKNVGAKPSQPTLLRFKVDDIQLGNDVPLNSLAPGRDTTVAATVTYSSLIKGVKVMQLQVDPLLAQTEEREDNNYATRMLIVGDAADLAHDGGITFNPNGFRAGDSVVISYPIRNKGTQSATAWVRFAIIENSGAFTAIDSVQVTLAGGASMVVSRKMLFAVEKGKVVVEIVYCDPVEFDYTNNSEVLDFSTVVPLTAPITVNGDLDMKNGLPGQLPGWIGGKLLLGDFDLVVKGQIDAADADHYIVTNGTGKLKIVNNNAVNVFPVGSSEGGSNFLKIANTGTPDNFSVGVLPYVLKQGMNGDTVRESFVDRTWLIEEEVPGGSNATVQFYWNASDELPLFDRMQAHTAHHTNNKWELGTMGMAEMDSIGRYRWTQGGFTGFSPFAITSNAAALPLRLLQFTVAQKGNAAELNWKSEAEVNTKHFVVEHSTDGTLFEDVGIVVAQNTAGVHHYQFTHPGLTTGQHYYRLRMVDIDEDLEYSPVRWIQVSNGEKLRVYPNPAQRMITVSGLAANGTVRIITMDGRVLKQVRTTGSVLTMDVSSLLQGTYVLQYINQGQQQQFTFIKQ